MAELGALNAELALAAPGTAAQALNRQFHRTLLDAARNRFLVKSMSALQRTLFILGPTTLAHEPRVQGAFAEHDAVLQGLRARDAHAAEEAMRAHIEAALKLRIKGMRDREIPMEDAP